MYQTNSNEMTQDIAETYVLGLSFSSRHIGFVTYIYAEEFFECGTSLSYFFL
jgi:hypothetical protein